MNMNQKLGTVVPSILFYLISLIYFCIYLNSKHGECWAATNTIKEAFSFNPTYVGASETYHDVTE